MGAVLVAVGTVVAADKAATATLTALVLPEATEAKGEKEAQTELVGTVAVAVLVGKVVVLRSAEMAAMVDTPAMAIGPDGEEMAAQADMGSTAAMADTVVMAATAEPKAPQTHEVMEATEVTAELVGRPMEIIQEVRAVTADTVETGGQPEAVETVVTEVVPTHIPMDKAAAAGKVAMEVTEPRMADAVGPAEEVAAAPATAAMGVTGEKAAMDSTLAVTGEMARTVEMAPTRAEMAGMADEEVAEVFTVETAEMGGTVEPADQTANRVPAATAARKATGPVVSRGHPAALE